MSERDCTHFTYRTPHGRITLAANGEAITSLAFGNAPLEGTPRPSELTTRASTEVLEYFAGKRTAFDVPLAPAGSPFQHAVWKAACAIPYGQTRTFSEIACLIGEPDAYRSVGAACRRNPLPILVPTHRIVGAKGAPTGTGHAAETQRFLLALEQQHRA